MNKKTVQEIFDLSLINLRKNRPLSSTKDIELDDTEDGPVFGSVVCKIPFMGGSYGWWDVGWSQSDRYESFKADYASLLHLITSEEDVLDLEDDESKGFFLDSLVGNYDFKCAWISRDYWKHTIVVYEDKALCPLPCVMI